MKIEREKANRNELRKKKTEKIEREKKKGEKYIFVFGTSVRCTKRK